MKSLVSIAATVALTVGAAGVAGAADAGNASGAGSASGSSGANSQTQSLIKEYQQKSGQLRQIQQKALDNNPDLKKQQQNYRDLVQNAIQEQGYDMDAGQQRLQDLAKKLQSGDLDKSQRKQVMQKFQSERQQMTSARQKAMNQPKVKQAGQKLQQDTIAAMKKINPKTDDLIKRLRAIQSQMRSSMGRSGGGSSASGGGNTGSASAQ